MENNNEKYEISVEKSIKNTCLYIKNISVNINSYETKVLIEENIPKIIKMEIGYENENTILKYDISNMTSLENYIKSNKLHIKDYAFILNSLDEVLAHIENYLISENSILLEINCIFYDDINNKLYFIVVPNLKADFSFELSKLLIRLLRFVDIEDKEAMTLAYRLFVKSSKENYTINDLLEVINENKKTVEASYDTFSYEKNYYDNLLSENKNFEDNIDKNEVENIDFMTVPKDYDINIDDDTKKILRENILEDFDKSTKASVMSIKDIFSKNKFNRLVNAHFRLSSYKKALVLFLMLIIPLLLYFCYGGEVFINYIPYIILYEVLFALFVFLNHKLEIIEKINSK